MLRGLVLAALMALAGCSDGSGSQFLPIGSRCSSDGQCGNTSFTCLTTRPSGYCTRSCKVDGDCPDDSACNDGQCLRRCQHDSDCRASEGYGCVKLKAAASVCDYAPAS